MIAAYCLLTARAGVSTNGELNRYVVEGNRYFPVSYLKVSIPELDRPNR